MPAPDHHELPEPEAARDWAKLRDEPDPGEVDQPLGSHPLAFLVVLALVVTVVYMMGDTLVRQVGVAATAGGPTLVEVPEVVGEDEDLARRLVGEAGLDVEITTAQNVNLPPGVVLEQRPPGGERVIEGTTVEITVSIGDEFVRMPDLRGSPLDEMYLLLAHYGLSLGDLGHEESDAARDEVIGQLPAPGEVVAVGTPVHLMLSAGPPMVQIPEVRRLPEDEAIAALAEAGFTVRTESRHSNWVTRGHAVSTAPDDEAPKGSVVVLHISIGPRPTTTRPPTTQPPTPEPGSTPSTTDRDGPNRPGRGGDGPPGPGGSGPPAGVGPASHDLIG